MNSDLPHHFTARRIPGQPDLLPTTYPHGAIDREFGCGEAIDSPHPACQARMEPYKAAERLHRPKGVFVYCRVCRSAWREVAA